LTTVRNATGIVEVPKKSRGQATLEVRGLLHVSPLQRSAFRPRLCTANSGRFSTTEGRRDIFICSIDLSVLSIRLRAMGLLARGRRRTPALVVRDIQEQMRLFQVRA
jgi:hypothetical protein